MSIQKKLKKAASNFLSKLTNQKFWEAVFKYSLTEMNFGNGGNFKQSGELYVARLVQKQFKQEPQITIFDVGANVGNYAKELSELFLSQAKIFSFEPSVNTYELFLKTTQPYNNIVAYNFGFSDKKSNQILYTNAVGSGLASVYQRKLDHFGINMDKSEEIKLTTIDDFCAENKIERIHFLKLDIEGHELSALKGAGEMIANNKIDFIQFEFGGCNIDSRTYFQDFFYILKDKYKIYRILKDSIVELPVYKETHEIFITINYLAIRK